MNWRRFTPPTPACKDGKSVPHPPWRAEWAHPAWKAVGFWIDAPDYYQYKLDIRNGEHVVLRLGDLDCDGRQSVVERVNGMPAKRYVEPRE